MNDQMTPALLSTNQSSSATEEMKPFDIIVSDQWTPEGNMTEVILEDEREDFLKIIETLTRIGILIKQKNRLVQTCHILKKRERFYIMHFKELFLLDGRKATNLSLEDVQRRNTITSLLEDWGLLKIVDKERMDTEGYVPLRKLKILSHADKNNYILDSKYTIGKSKKFSQYSEQN